MFPLRYCIACYSLIYTGAIGGLKVEYHHGQDAMTEGDEE